MLIQQLPGVASDSAAPSERREVNQEAQSCDTNKYTPFTVLHLVSNKHTCPVLSCTPAWGTCEDKQLFLIEGRFMLNLYQGSTAQACQNHRMLSG